MKGSLVLLQHGRASVAETLIVPVESIVILCRGRKSRGVRRDIHVSHHAALAGGAQPLVLGRIVAVGARLRVRPLL